MVSAVCPTAHPLVDIHGVRTYLTHTRRTLSASQKEQYINAVKCMQSLPAKSIFDGVKTRFDDFQALHINMTLSIHYVVCGVACIRLMANENEGF